MSTERLSANKRKRRRATMRERMRNRKIVNVLCLFLAVVLAFAVGFAVRSNTALVQSLGFPVDAPRRAPMTPYRSAWARPRIS